jgi:hypothetical protein
MVLGVDFVVAKDTNEAELGSIPPHGALVHCGINHFRVALPKKIEEIMFEEQDG